MVLWASISVVSTISSLLTTAHNRAFKESDIISQRLGSRMNSDYQKPSGATQAVTYLYTLVFDGLCLAPTNSLESLACWVGEIMGNYGKFKFQTTRRKSHTKELSS